MKIPKIIYFTLFLIAISNLKAQTVQLPKIISASPEAASLGQYGAVPVNLFTGQINYTIPIYTIKVGDFEFPLTLSYNYNGFKPDTDPTMVGMGWTANFAGAVIRQLKGLPDEDPNGYFLYGNTYENINNLPVESQVYYLTAAAGGSFDTRPDKFIINTPTIKGSFRFKTDKTAVFSEPRNYKVILANGGSLSSISIKDDKGILYEFDEQEFINNRSWDNDEETTYIGSWNLGKITLPNSIGEIDFVEYEVCGVNHNYVTTSNTVRGTIVDGYHSTFSNHFSDDYINSKIIKRINFPNGYILFDQDFFLRSVPTSGYVTGYSTDQVKLQSIRVYNSDDKLVDKFIFDYYDSGYYYFLKSIKKEDNNGTQIDYYSFEYSDLSVIPTNRITNNYVDLWGFYNGIPINETDLTSTLNPSFVYGRIGALTKITYPTKGTTDIIYEPNEIRRSGTYYDDSNPSYDASDFVELYAEDVNNDCDGRIKPIFIPFAQQVKVILEVEVTPRYAWAKSSLYDDNGYYEHCSLIKNGEILGPGENKYFLEEHTLTLGYGTHYLKVELCQADPNTGGHYAKVSIQYRTIPYSQDPITTNIEVGGIRVKETRDCPSGETNNCVIKTYKYLSGYELNPSESSGFLTERNPRLKSTTIEKIVYQGGCLFDYSTGGLVLSSNWTANNYYEYTESYRPLTPLTTLGSHILYNRVEILNNNETYGKTVNYYSHFDKGIYYPQFPDLYTDVDFKNGKISRQELFQKKPVGPVNKQVQDNLYTETLFNSPNYVFECEIMRYPTVITCDSYTSSRPGDFTIGSVKHQSNDYLLTSSNTKLIEENGNINSKTSYVYDPVTGYPTEVSLFNSDGTIKKTCYKYPYDVTSAVTNDMVNRNMISSVIEQTETLNTTPTTPLNSVRTNYSYWKSNSQSATITSGYLQIEQEMQTTASSSFSITKPMQLDLDMRFDLCAGNFILTIDGGVSTFQESYNRNQNGGNCYLYSSPIHRVVDLLPGNYTMTFYYDGQISDGFYGQVSYTGTYTDSRLDMYATDTPTNMIYPLSVDVKIGENPYETRLNYHSYDINGNIMSVSKTNDVKEIYIWGYNGEYPVAKIVNGDYAIIETLLGGWIAVKDFSLKPVPTDTEIKTFLLPLTNQASEQAKKMQVSVYTYAPLIGMTSQTDPSGKTIYYNYDSFGRLETIKDQDGIILKHYEYKYAGGN